MYHTPVESISLHGSAEILLVAAMLTDGPGIMVNDPAIQRRPHVLQTLHSRPILPSLPKPARPKDPQMRHRRPSGVRAVDYPGHNLYMLSRAEILGLYAP